ncbi:MAG: MurR/RpiR family transcriptional regulator [Pseudomonadota bacterium]
MNDTDVSQTLDRIAEALPGLPGETKKAATYLLENPTDVGLSTIREMAAAADVTPATLMRMAQRVGFEGYDDLRAPFREALRQGSASFPDRARWLQDLAATGDLGPLYSDMVGTTLRNIEETFAKIDAEALKAAAQTIWDARAVFTLGVGSNNANAQNFTYLASTGMVDFTSIPRPGSVPTDDLAFADKRDVLIAITCKPYRREVVEAVDVAKEQGMKIIGISDSPASPLILGATHGFVVSTESPQFFPSSVATIALLETLLSFVIAQATPEIVERVEKFHARRHRIGIYLEE